jgi:hypothetical protein
MAGAKKNKELNLLVALDRGVRRHGPGRGIAAIIALIALVAVAVAFFYLHVTKETDSLEGRRDSALAYLDDPAVQAQYDESIARQQEAKTAQQRTEALAAAADAINSYPDLGGKDYKEMYSIAGDSVDLSEIAYDRATGTLSFNAKSQSATRVPLFIAALRASGIFSDVNYVGYMGGMSTVAGEPSTTPDGEVIETEVSQMEYSFAVTCIVNTDEQRAAVATEPDEEEDEDDEGEDSEDESADDAE